MRKGEESRRSGRERNKMFARANMSAREDSSF